MTTIGQQAAVAVALTELRSERHPRQLAHVTHREIISALGQFREGVRYLNTRRSKGAVLNLDGEGDVQDAVYLMLRPWVVDLVPENPTDKSGNRFAIKDFLSRNAKTVVEIKYIRGEAHGRNIGMELHDDIEMYHKHPDCENLVFFVYDPDSYIPDAEALRRDVEEERRYGRGMKQLHCYLIIH